MARSSYAHQAAALPATVPLAIVGAGLHGVTIALHLLERNICTLDQIALFDPAGRPLQSWVELTQRLGMREMRSPWFHHVMPETLALFDYAKQKGLAPLGRGLATPPVDLFNRWNQAMAGPLEPVTYQAQVKRMLPLAGGQDGYRLLLQTPTGEQTCHAQFVIYAPGMAGQERWPAEVLAAREQQPDRVLHSSRVDVRAPHWLGERVLVVGAGLTGGTLALRLQEQGARVTLISRSQVRQRRYDVDDTWMKNAGKLKRFYRIENPEERALVVTNARRGSVTPEVLYRLRNLQRQGALTMYQDCTVRSLRPAGPEKLEAVLAMGEGGYQRMEVNRVVVACGFQLDAARDPVLQDIFALPQTRCVAGRPILSGELELLPGLYLSGWMAELHLGPQARNIIGARLAARVLRESGRLMHGLFQASRRSPAAG